MKPCVLIVAPSLDSSQNVSGVSAVASFIIHNNKEYSYTHFQQGKNDNEAGGICRFTRLLLTILFYKKI